MTRPCQPITPLPGMFLKLIEGYGVAFCLEVKRLHDCAKTHAPGVIHMVCTRWGIDDSGQPFDDGHKKDCFYTDIFRPVGQIAWRMTCSQRPSYLRQINTTPANWQLEMFA